MSQEHSAYTEPVSLKINIGQRSHEHNEAHKRNGDNDNEIGLVDIDDFFEDSLIQEDTIDTLHESSEEYHEEETKEDDDGEEVIDSVSRWDSEQIEDVATDEHNETEAVIDETPKSGFSESVEDGAFMITAEVVRQYGLAYPGGYMTFERDFQTKWVEQIQNPLGEEIQAKKSEKNKMDVFTQFSHVTLEEFNEVVTLTEFERDEYLAEHHMDKDDFKNWELVIKYWEEAEDLAFSDETFVADIAKGAFIAELEKAKIE